MTASDCELTGKRPIHSHNSAVVCTEDCPRWADHAPWECGPDCREHNPTPPEQSADDADVVDAQIIPYRPSNIQWATPSWVVTLHRDGGIRLWQAHALEDDEIEAVGNAYSSARWFRDHMAELGIGS